MTALTSGRRKSGIMLIDARPDNNVGSDRLPQHTFALRCSRMIANPPMTSAPSAPSAVPRPKNPSASSAPSAVTPPSLRPHFSSSFRPAFRWSKFRMVLNTRK